MLDELNFVKGAVSSKDLIPILTHFHFYNGRVQGGNGKMCMDAPCDLDGKELTVPAERFVKAVDASKSKPRLSVSKAGKLTITAGKLRVVLPLAMDAFPLQAPEGDLLVGTEVVDVLSALRPFIGTDASRPWACGILLQDGHAYATNNIIMARMPIEWDGPPINLPSFAVDELVRIGQEAQQVQVCERSMTFLFGERWLKTQLLEAEWPDVDNFFTKRKLPAIPDELATSVDTIVPFCPDPAFPEIQFGENGVSTADGEMSASVSGIELPEARFRAESLQLVLKYATNMKVDDYPKPVEFAGDNGLRGVLVGLRA